MKVISQCLPIIYATTFYWIVSRIALYDYSGDNMNVNQPT